MTSERERARRHEQFFLRLSQLLLGMALLVLAGMNLFTNLLDWQQGHWTQNQLLSTILTLLAATIPAAAGAWLVLAATSSRRVDGGKEGTAR